MHATVHTFKVVVSPRPRNRELRPEAD